jgi:two-component system alkaline phosphatase synthesis response regulator PhoP
VAGPSHHLLVIDDEPHIGRIVRMTFERGPYRVSLAHDGAAGLAFLAEHDDVDCVLVDLNMPGMSGTDFLRAARAETRWAKIPMLVLTAAGQIGQVEEAREQGAAAIITKPFSPKKLYRQICEVLGADPDADVGGES